MMVCLSWARNFLYQLLILINVNEMINTRSSLIAYIMIYKFIAHLVCGYNIDGGGYCTPWKSVGLFWYVYCSVVNCHIWLL